MRTAVWLIYLGGCSQPLALGDAEERPDGPIPVTHGIDRLVDSAAVDDALLPVFDDGGVGLGVAVIKDGEVVFSAGYGWANLAENRPLTPDTPMQIGSVSKLFIAVAAMQGVEAGRLELDDPIADLVGFDVDNPRIEGEVISLRHLLTHVSGIRDSGEYDKSYEPGGLTVPLMAFQRSYLLPDGPRYGTRNFYKESPGIFAYSNVGAALGALGVAEAAELEFEDVVARDILAPLGMTHSGYFDEAVTDDMATPYGKNDRPWGEYSFPTYPDGLMRSSPNDLGTFMAAIQAGGVLGEARILQDETVREMLTVDTTIGTDEAGQAIGWARLELGEGRVAMGHSGGDPGVAALLAFDPELGVGVVMAVNSPEINVGAALVVFDDLFEVAVEK